MIKLRMFLGLTEKEFGKVLNREAPVIESVVRDWESRVRPVPINALMNLEAAVRDIAGSRLSEIREELELTNGEFGRMLRPDNPVSVPTLLNWYKNKHFIPLDVLISAGRIIQEGRGYRLRAICMGLGLSVEDLGKALNPKKPIIADKILAWETGAEIIPKRIMTIAEELLKEKSAERMRTIRDILKVDQEIMGALVRPENPLHRNTIANWEGGRIPKGGRTPVPIHFLIRSTALLREHVLSKAAQEGARAEPALAPEDAQLGEIAAFINNWLSGLDSRIEANHGAAGRNSEEFNVTPEILEVALGFTTRPLVDIQNSPAEISDLAAYLAVSKTASTGMRNGYLAKMFYRDALEGYFAQLPMEPRGRRLRRQALEGSPAEALQDLFAYRDELRDKPITITSAIDGSSDVPKWRRENSKTSKPYARSTILNELEALRLAGLLEIRDTPDGPSRQTIRGKESAYYLNNRFFEIKDNRTLEEICSFEVGVDRPLQHWGYDADIRPYVRNEIAGIIAASKNIIECGSLLTNDGERVLMYVQKEHGRQKIYFCTEPGELIGYIQSNIYNPTIYELVIRPDFRNMRFSYIMLDAYLAGVMEGMFISDENVGFDGIVVDTVQNPLIARVLKKYGFKPQGENVENGRIVVGSENENGKIPVFIFGDLARAGLEANMEYIPENFGIFEIVDEPPENGERLAIEVNYELDVDAGRTQLLALLDSPHYKEISFAVGQEKGIGDLTAELWDLFRALDEHNAGRIHEIEAEIESEGAVAGFVSIELISPNLYDRIVSLANENGFNEAKLEQIEKVAEELGKNISEHGLQGYLVARIIEDENGKGIEIVAIDVGPGLKGLDSVRAMRPGYSTVQATNRGYGLPIIESLTDYINIESPGEELGTKVTVRKYTGSREGVVAEGTTPPEGAAVHFRDDLKTLAREAKDKGEELVIGVDTDIGNLGYYAQDLLGVLTELTGQEGLENVTIIADSGTVLKARVAERISAMEKDQKRVKTAIISREENVQSRVFDQLKDRASLVSVDDSRVMEDRNLIRYIPILKIIACAVRRALDKPHESIPHVEESEEGGILKFIILPEAEPLSGDEIIDRYKEEAQFAGKA
ncbi:MAG: hypothetical protein COS99_02505 [Candidatus Omnitrophica bacterium CG07_land_8_20_14_0_80_42_15]|uniref:Histidine kinase/HSP90-like ATPase domain-containing protein n=1 Tax=Candidatus Aquitaenariimonas noxiae TaxID=1974741 RepID=A0A2J0KTZ2_9BACT|nr:MAG: hypothetical protein COS99_02505 [Candidatus Omnitrophica bacterium CG07_land_8_20_14_0_80_42_15]